MKKHMVGICKVCGSMEIRPAPADVAVCGACYSHNPQLVSLVELRKPAEVLRQVETAKHPAFRFKVTAEKRAEG